MKIACTFFDLPDQQSTCLKYKHQNVWSMMFVAHTVGEKDKPTVGFSLQEEDVMEGFNKPNKADHTRQKNKLCGPGGSVTSTELKQVATAWRSMKTGLLTD